MRAALRRLERLDDQVVYLASLVAIAFAVLAFMVVPLTGLFVPMHELPTNRDFNIQGKPEGKVLGFWLFGMGGYALAIWQWRRGRRPSWQLLLTGAVLLNLLALLVPPVASEDVYAYSFYGKVQVEYGQNPYTTFPHQHSLHPWYPFWSWRQIGPVYGPPFLLVLRAVAMLAGPSLLAWVIWMKLILVAAEAAAVWLLVRLLTRRAVPGSPDPRWPVLLIAWSPMVLQSIAMSAHVDAFLLLLLAGAVAAHRYGRHLVAFTCLVGSFLVKVYMGPLGALYAIWLGSRQPPGRRLATVVKLGAYGTALTVLAYLPYASAGTWLFASAADVGSRFTSGSPPNIARLLVTSLLPLAGVTDTTAAEIGNVAGRQVGWLSIITAFTLVAWRLARQPGAGVARARAGTPRPLKALLARLGGGAPAYDPWPLIGTYFLAYLLCTPWVFYWHEVPLLAIVGAVPWSLTSAMAVTFSISMVPLWPRGRWSLSGGSTPPRQLIDTLFAWLSRYGPAFLALWWGWRARRRPSAAPPPEAPAPEPLTSRR